MLWNKRMRLYLYILSQPKERGKFSQQTYGVSLGFIYLIFSHTKIISFPRSQITSKAKMPMNIIRRNHIMTMRNGKSKRPIPIKIATITKNINPTKNAFILFFLLLLTTHLSHKPIDQYHY